MIDNILISMTPKNILVGSGRICNYFTNQLAFRFRIRNSGFRIFTDPQHWSRLISVHIRFLGSVVQDHGYRFCYLPPHHTGTVVLSK
jgi:hypothetical protein